MTGEVIYLFAFDVGNEIVSARIGPILGQPPTRLDIRRDHTSPRDVPLHQPVCIEARSALTAGGRPIRVQIRVFEVGVISLLLRLEVQSESLSALRQYHRLSLDDGREIEAAAQDLCAQIVRELGHAIVKPAPSTIPEAYTVFALSDLGGPRDVPSWVAGQQGTVAGLLSDVDPERLAESQVAEVLRHRQSFEKTDLVIVDWDAALVVDLCGYVDDVLYVLELANMQLEEFRVMDAALDRQLTKAYGLLEKLPRFLVARPMAGLRYLRELSVDLTKLADEVTHTSKFLGDWYLARVYLSARERFHLEEWRSSVSLRLRQLNELYSVVRAEVNERRMIWLEVMIVVFFAIDLLAILVFKQ
jgi:hypothetical protein